MRGECVKSEKFRLLRQARQFISENPITGGIFAFLSVAGLGVVLCAVVTWVWTRDLGKAAEIATIALALGTMLMAAAVVISAAAAYISYQDNRRIAKTRLTMDQISRQVHDKDIITIFNGFRAIRQKYELGKDPENPLTHSMVIEADLNTEKMLGENGIHANARQKDRDVIINLLNYYETWALGIERQAYDEEMLRDWWRSSLVADYLDLKSYVDTHRKALGNFAAFEGFEKLARKWASADEARRGGFIPFDENGKPRQES